MQSSEQASVRKPRLELVWINKDKRPQLVPRILQYDPDRSYPRHAPGDENRLIFGDNLLALKALEQEFAGKVKCCFIDPHTTPAVPLSNMTMAWSIRYGLASCVTGLS